MEAVVNGGKAYSSVQNNWSEIYLEGAFETVEKVCLLFFHYMKSIYWLKNYIQRFQLLSAFQI